MSNQGAEKGQAPPHIEVEGGPDRDVYLNGERLDHTDGGLHHIQLQRDLGEKTAQFTIGYDDRITASVEIFELPKPDPVENVSLERLEDTDRVTFHGVAAGEEMLVELVKRGESDGD